MPNDPQPKQGNPLIGLLILAGVAAFAALNIGVYWYATNAGRPASERLSLGETVKNLLPGAPQTPTVTPIPTATPSPTPRPYVNKPKFEFSVSMANPTGPRFTGGEITPFIPKAGQAWKVSIGINSDQPVTKATVIYKTDKKDTPVPLKLVRGTDKAGMWEAVWNVDDTYDYRYRIRLEAQSAAGKGETEISIRGSEKL